MPIKKNQKKTENSRRVIVSKAEGREEKEKRGQESEKKEKENIKGYIMIHRDIMRL